MKAKILVGIVVALLGWQGAMAHTQLVKSVPEKNSELAVAPKQTTLTFAALVQLTAVSILSSDSKPLPLKPLPADMVKEATFNLPALAPGKHVIKWRAAGHDGHIMSGEIHFTVLASKAAAPVKHKN